MGYKRALVHDDLSLLSDQDLYLFNEGTHVRLWEKLGAHSVEGGAYFAVWAPNAERVSVIGDFNDWDPSRHPLRSRDRTGVWEGVVAGITRGTRYKYRVASRYGGYRIDKADPFGLLHEAPPQTASRLWSLEYVWGDGAWMAERAARDVHEKPVSVYEMHLGSWRRSPETPNLPLGYRDLAEPLAAYARDTGFTDVELLPLMEHPFYGSWGYQITGYFAPTARYGTPQDLMFLVDTLHRHGIGVILDWVPSHFPTDAHGLGFFDGTHLFEHGDPRQGFHPDWQSFIFNYGRNEVRSFLLSNALFWLEQYHADGLRVDAVASMLYLDYSRREGEWIPNRYGGRENLDAIDFLRRFNERVYEHQPGVQTTAEESTSWPAVSRPTYLGGLGFGFKWDMGWMHDTLDYMAREPVHRKFHHTALTFRGLYATSENFVLPLSHDEVVHGKGSLINKMSGDRWQRFANLRLLLGYMWTLSGKKLLFMGGELAQWREWNHDTSLDWHLLDEPEHAGVQRWVRDLNAAYRGEPALHELDCQADGFAWIDCSDAVQSTLLYLRRGRAAGDVVVVACNFTPVPRHGFRVGVPNAGWWHELLNSDAAPYGGSGQGNFGGVSSDAVAWHGHAQSLVVTLPPLGIVVLKAPASDPRSQIVG
ncbi:MAG TPA: 1,4-alpha-glucan branching protein GlgB [Candidatus Binatia bacterium]|nr:1,4-alpha-glucan branching protein GlgB [Candidatus Binatia bacterium]